MWCAQNTQVLVTNLQRLLCQYREYIAHKTQEKDAQYKIICFAKGIMEEHKLPWSFIFLVNSLRMMK